MVAVKLPESIMHDLATPIAVARRRLAEGRSLEEMWGSLRADGYDMFDSKWITMAVTDLSSIQARRALYESETWADMRPAIDRLEDDMISAALSMGAEVRIDGERIHGVPKR